MARLAAERQKERPSVSAPSVPDPSPVGAAPSERLLPYQNHLAGGLWPEWMQATIAEGAPGSDLQRARRVVEEVLARTLGLLAPARRTALVQVVLQSWRRLDRLAGHPFLAPLLSLLARRVEGQLARRARGRLSLSETELEELWPEAESWLRGWLARVEGQEGVVTTVALAHHLSEALAGSEAPLTWARERIIAERVADFLGEEVPGNGLDLEGAALLAAAVDAAAAPGRRAEERLVVARGVHRGQFTQAQADLEAQFAAEVELVPAARPIFESLQRTLRVMAQGAGLAGLERVAQIYRRRSEGLRYLQQHEGHLPQLQDNLQLLTRWLEDLAPTPLAELALGFAARILAAGRGKPQDKLHLDLLPGPGAGARAAGVIRALLRCSHAELSPALTQALGGLEGRTELGLLQFALCLAPEDLEVGGDQGLALVNTLAQRPVWPSAAHSNQELMAYLGRRRGFIEAFRANALASPGRSTLAEAAAVQLSGDVAQDLAELGRAIAVAFPKVALHELWADDPVGPGLLRLLRRTAPGSLLEVWPELVSVLYAAQLQHQDPAAQQRTLRITLARAARWDGPPPEAEVRERRITGLIQWLGTPPPAGEGPAPGDPVGPASASFSSVFGELDLMPLTPKGRAELLACRDTIRALLDHLEEGSGAGPQRSSLYSVLRAVAAGEWPMVRYQGPLAERLLAPLSADQQGLWRQASSFGFDDRWRPDREVLLCRQRLAIGLGRFLATLPALPDVTAPDLSGAIKGTAEHRRRSQERQVEQDRRTLEVLSSLLPGVAARGATFTPALKITLGPARAALARLGQGPLADWAAALERAAAFEGPRDPGAPWAMDEDRLWGLWGELPPGPHHPRGFRRWVTLNRAVHPHEKVVRVHQGQKMVALAGLMVVPATWPGGRGPVLWLGPVEANQGCRAEHHALAEAQAIHKASILGLPLVCSSPSLPKAAARAGQACRGVHLSLVIDHGATGWVHLPGVLEDHSAGAGRSGPRSEVQVDLQMISPRP